MTEKRRSPLRRSPLAVRVSPELEAAVANAAGQLDVTVPEYVRQLLLSSTGNTETNQKENTAA